MPTLCDLLEPVDKRSKIFCRGYDVYNPIKVGFGTTKREANTIGLTDNHEREKLREDVERIETRFDVSERASGNQDYAHGIEFPEKDALETPMRYRMTKYHLS
ncbi:MAG: hypothetical protein P0119_06985 [Nitrospira sp.]|nr:hypothetical protein [Nitrospira sp.]